MDHRLKYHSPNDGESDMKKLLFVLYSKKRNKNWSLIWRKLDIVAWFKLFISTKSRSSFLVCSKASRLETIKCYGHINKLEWHLIVVHYTPTILRHPNTAHNSLKPPSFNNRDNFSFPLSFWRFQNSQNSITPFQYLV